MTVMMHPQWLLAAGPGVDGVELLVLDKSDYIAVVHGGEQAPVGTPARQSKQSSFLTEQSSQRAAVVSATQSRAESELPRPTLRGWHAVG